MKILVGAAIALAGLAVGPWYLSGIGGMVTGFWVIRRGWLAGAAAVSVAWLAALIWNYSVAATEVGNLSAAMGEFVGIPGWLFPIATIILGLVLGLTTGAVGSSVAALRPK